MSDNNAMKEGIKQRATDRRTILKAAGASGIAALAGCSSASNSGGSSSSSSSSSTTGSTTSSNSGSSGGDILIGGTVPQSGPYGAFGLNEKKGIQLAIEDANANGDAGNRNVSAKFIDTKTDPGAGRKKATELLNSGADFLVGSLSSSVALAISDLAKKNQTLYIGFAGSNKLTGSGCNKYTFIGTSSAVMQTSSGLGYVLNSGKGNSVFEIAADYAWGHSIQSWNENHLVPNAGGNYVGKKFVPLGTNNFSQAITEAKNSGADIIEFTEFGHDFQTSAKQANQYGAFDSAVCVWPSVDIVDAKPVGQNVLSNSNFYAGTSWYYQQTHSQPGQQFAQKFMNKFNEPPTSFAAAAYASTRTLLQKVGSTGSKNSSDIANALEGAKMQPQLWNVGEHFRKQDHRATISSPTVQGRDPSQVNGWNMFKIVDFPTNPEKTQMRPANQTNCKL